MTQEIRTRLLLMADAQYGSFSKSLIPECKPLLGVRLPALRKMAQEFVKNKEWKELVQTDGADDVYFEEAGRFIIEKDKASIGMLQRVYKIGFNRAARIMDQLCDAGVVGTEEGTKPRKVLMSMDEFQTYVEEHL